MGLIAAIVIYSVKRKFFPVMYLVSIALYIFTIGFVIDIYDLSKDGVLLVLAFSAIVFMVLGYYFSSKFRKGKEEIANKIPARR